MLHLLIALLRQKRSEYLYDGERRTGRGRWKKKNKWAKKKHLLRRRIEMWLVACLSARYYPSNIEALRIRNKLRFIEKFIEGRPYAPCSYSLYLSNRDYHLWGEVKKKADTSTRFIFFFFVFFFFASSISNQSLIYSAYRDQNLCYDLYTIVFLSALWQTHASQTNSNIGLPKTNQWECKKKLLRK